MNKTFIIAEVAQAHDGSLGIAHSFIDALKNSGVDAIKFQTHIAEAESSQYEPFRINFSYKDKTRFDYWKRMEFSYDEWKGLKDHCEEIGVEFMSSPFSNAAVDLLEKIGVKRYKVGSGEVNNFLLLEKIARTKKPVIISSGMSSFKEIEEAVNFLKYFGYNRNNLTVMQCSSEYPTSCENIGLNVIDQLRQKYDFPIGYSDHSGKIYPIIAAVARGAKVVEFHITFDKRMFGPDASSSLTIDETKEVVKAIRCIENSDVNKNDIYKYKNMKKIFEKSLCVNTDLKKGDVITFDVLDAKKPANYGISAKNYKNVIGKKLKKNLKAWEFLRIEDIE